MSTEYRRVVGFKVTNDEFNVLQAYANEMYNFQVTDPQTNAAGRTKSRPIDKRLPLHILDNST